MGGSCSIRDVAKRANVAASTVSRILNQNYDEGRITESTRQKVMEAVRQLNYSPNINARRLFSKRTDIIGLLTPSYRKMGNHIFQDAHLTRIISGLEEGFGDSQYSLLLLFNDDNFIQQKRFLTLFRERNIDGLIIWGAKLNETYWNELLTENYPALFLATCPEADQPLNLISADYEQAGYLAATHLLSKGYRQLAWVGGYVDSSVVCQQRQGVRRALEEAGLDFDAMPSRFGNYLSATGEALAGELFDAGVVFSAVLAANLPIADGVMKAAARRGLSVPEQLAVIGCDSIKDDDPKFNFSKLLIPDLEIGRAAAAGIVELIENQKRIIQRKIPVELWQGQSS